MSADSHKISNTNLITALSIALFTFKFFLSRPDQTRPEQFSLPAPRAGFFSYHVMPRHIIPISTYHCLTWLLCSKNDSFWPGKWSKAKTAICSITGVTFWLKKRFWTLKNWCSLKSKCKGKQRSSLQECKAYFILRIKWSFLIMLVLFLLWMVVYLSLQDLQKFPET